MSEVIDNEIANRPTQVRDFIQARLKDVRYDRKEERAKRIHLEENPYSHYNECDLAKLLAIIDIRLARLEEEHSQLMALLE